PARPGRMHPQRLQLRAEYQGPAADTVIERLLAEAVAGQIQAPRLPVPECKGKHAAQPRQCLFKPPGVDSGQDDFGVGPPAKVLACRPQLLGQRAEVVDLAVEGKAVATAA